MYNYFIFYKADKMKKCKKTGKLTHNFFLKLEHNYLLYSKYVSPKAKKLFTKKKCFRLLLLLLLLLVRKKKPLKRNYFTDNETDMLMEKAKDKSKLFCLTFEIHI